MGLNTRGTFYLFIYDIYLSKKYDAISEVLNSLENIGFEFEDYKKETLLDKKNHEYEKSKNMETKNSNMEEKNTKNYL